MIIGQRDVGGWVDDCCCIRVEEAGGNGRPSAKYDDFDVVGSLESSSANGWTVREAL
jgi:hypothetical protein